MTTIVFETHSWSEDNDLRRATGWGHSRLSDRGRALAAELGVRRRDDGLAAVIASDLRRAAETAEIAFGGLDMPVFLDWRLRECDYGELNGQPVDVVHGAVSTVDDRYSGGESWREAAERCTDGLRDVAARWDGRRVLVIGHMSAYFALEQLSCRRSIEDVHRAPFVWREGWEYEVSPGATEKPVDGAAVEP